MEKTILHLNEVERLKTKHSYHIFDTLPEDEYKNITQMAAQICQMPIALISLVDEFRQWFKTRQGFIATQTPDDIVFCPDGILNTNEPVIVEDVTKDPRFVENILVSGTPDIRFYAGMPITNDDNSVMGTLCVMDHKPRQLSAEQIDYLHLLAQSVNQRFKEQKQNFKLQADISNFNHAILSASIVSQTDIKGRITYVNNWFVEITGYGEAELLGQDHRLLNSGHHPKEFWVDMWKTIAAGNTWRGDVKNKAKDGTYYWVDSVITPIKDATGNIEGYLSVRNLITERKKAEEERDMFFSVSSNMTCIAGTDGHFKEINAAFEETLGYSKSELLSKSFMDFIHPDDVQPTLRELESLSEGIETISFLNRYKCKDGTYKWLEWNSKPVGSLIYAIARDVTKSKKAEEKILQNQKKFQEVVNNINDGLLIDDLEGRVVFGNNRLLEMFGMTDEDLTDLKIEDYVAPGHRALLRDRHTRRIAGEEVPDIFEFEGLLKSGGKRWFEARVSKVFENGIIKGTQSAIRDVTDRKKDEALLTQINQVVSVKTGKSYFSELTAFLCSQLDVKYAFVGHYLPGANAIETISWRSDGEELPNMTYSLFGTPCDTVLKSDTCVYPSNVQSLFPEDEDLKTLNAESYLGTQLRDENNELLGIIVLMDDKPMQDADAKKKIISIAAPRTANEIKQRGVLKQLRESEEKYRNLFQKMNEGLVQISPNGIIQLVNPKYAEITGYSEAELLGQNIYELLFSKEKCTFLKDKIKREDAPISEHYETEYITKTGDSIWVNVSESAQYNQDGRFDGITSIVSDISARKKADEKIIQSQQLLQNLTDQVPGAVYQFQMYPDGRMYFPYISSGVAALLPGIAPEELIRNESHFFEPIHPKDQPAVKAAIMQSYQSLEKLNLQYRIVLPDGSIRWHADNSIPEKQSDGSVTWYGLISDITEEKQLQQQAEEAARDLKQQFIEIQELKEKFASILHNTSDLIHSVDAQGNLSYVNQAWLDKLGYHSENEVVGKAVFNFIAPECAPQCQELFMRMVQGEKIQFAEMSFISTSGIEIDCEATITTNFVDGKLISAECFFRDVTELKKERLEKEKLMQNALAVLEEKVQDRTVELEDANKELEAFSYTVSHDLQAPLRSISGFSTLLMRNHSNLLDEQGKEFLGIIDTSAKQMSRLIHGLLHFSRLGKVEVTHNDVNMDDLVRIIVEDAKFNHKSLKAKIILHPLQSTPCDRNLMKQVWTNLISNAIKYSSKKENPVVEIGMQEENGEKAYFVKDNGDGFDMKQVHRLFEVFQRLHLSTEFKGTGIGLATVKRIILKHGGRVWADGEKGQGATFYFTLPS